MITEIVLRRMLYVGTGLIFVVALMLASIVIPSARVDTTPGATPDSAIPAMWVLVIIHLLFVAALMKVIFDNQRKGIRIPKGLLVGAGVVLLLLGLVLSDGASAYLKHGPGMHTASISMFVCIGCDFLAAVTAFLAAFFKPGKMAGK